MTCSQYTSLDAITINLDIYTQIGINEYMCSADCPCKNVETKNQWLELDVSQIENRDMTCRPFDFSGQKGLNLVNFTTYKQCIMETEETTSLSAGSFPIFAKKFREQDDFSTIMEWIEFFEEEYSCSGICEPVLFYWSKSIEIGRPTKSCVGSIKDDLTGSFTGMAGATLAGGIFLFLTWIMQYCLWRKF